MVRLVEALEAAVRAYDWHRVNLVLSEMKAVVSPQGVEPKGKSGSKKDAA